MRDTYKNFAELKKAKPFAFKIKKTSRESGILIFSPHGGGIEPGTTEICDWFNKESYSCYSFVAVGNGCKKLHLTSTHFDEPELLKMLKRHPFAVSFHGMDDSEIKKYKADILLGGRNDKLMAGVRKNLNESGFSVAVAGEHPDSMLCGRDKDNVTNKCASGKGLQIEISQRLRAKFFQGDFSKAKGRVRTTATYAKFCSAIEVGLV